MKTKLSQAQIHLIIQLQSRPSFVHRSDRFVHLNSILSNEEYEKQCDFGSYRTHTIGHCYLTTVDSLIRKGILVLYDKREAYVLNATAISELLEERKVEKE